MNEFHVVAVDPPTLAAPSIAIAAARAGGIGILDLEWTTDLQRARQAIAHMARFVDQGLGIRLDGADHALVEQLLNELPQPVQYVLLVPHDLAALPRQIEQAHSAGRQAWLEVTTIDAAQLGQQLGADGLVVKGHESGGWVGDETAFILLQHVRAHSNLPVWVQGGIGLHTAAACYTAGATGVVLDFQLALTRESQLPDAVKQAIANMDGSETACLGADLGLAVRVYSQRTLAPVEQLQTAAQALALQAEERDDRARQWRAAVAARIGWDAPGQQIWPIGQDAAFAKALAARFGTVGGVITAVRESVHSHLHMAQELQPLAADAPLARSHGTRYPIVQGPMTRVSDTADFALSVAEGGGLPFLALALLRAPEVEALLAETQRRLEKRPWGVGILGFVPPHLRQEQMEVIQRYRPPYALIAGGRPDQAHYLEQHGIPSYLHVPSPGLLRLFLQDGTRRFVFEGRECGGHVGPRSSFVLWNTMIDVLLEAVPAAEAAQCHVLFAGGIHDATSSAMVAAMAAPLAARGMRIGVLMGTAYLLTHEAVAAGAIMPGFQEEARRCQTTALLETGPGHATRCAETSFVELFRQEKQRLMAADMSGEELRGALEDLNLGRLRMASKGITRHPHYGQDPQAPKFAMLNDAEQRAEGMYMIGQVAALRQDVVSIAELHHEVAVTGSARLAAADRYAEQEPMLDERPCDIAIVGMSCLLPKAPDLQTYWENILNKVDAITDVPPERWDWKRHFDPDRKARDKIYSHWGGFLEDVAFDPTQFGIPPNALRSIEPIQLLVLEAVRSLLHDAGYAERPFPRERTSVILGAGGGAGAMGEEYAVRASLPELLDEVPDEILAQLPEWTEDSFPGLLLNVIAGRVANRFDLGGVNYTVDAACASSLAAVYLAARELETGTSDVVITGGIDNVQNPFGFMCFSKTQALSPRGRCRTFDDGADGIAISEGVALIALKRLADAERDGDRIYAVIKGVAGSSDGRDRSLTAPRPEGQARALERAYAKARISPATVTLIEAHGTGTVVGDQAEVATLKRVFSAAGASQQSCAIGSVKSMIGHTKCAAGVAGLIKVALALYHKVLPPTLGVEKPNSRVGFEESPFYVNTELRPWLQGASSTPRRAGVSAFGFGGTNFHVVAEEYTGDFLPRPAATQRWPNELFVWSAATTGELAKALSALEQALAGDGQPQLHDLAYAVYQAGKRQLAYAAVQLAIVATSLEDLRDKLRQAIAALTAAQPMPIFNPQGIYFSPEPLGRAGNVAFVFPGQGSQYPNMLRDLANMFPEVRAGFEHADSVLHARLDQPLSHYVFPPAAFTPAAEQEQHARLTATNVAQPALGAAGMALVQLLTKLGIQPDMVAGHSYGEYVALCAAGAMDQTALALLSEARGRSIIEAAQDDLGTMAAVQAEPAKIRPLLEDMDDVWIANLNAPQQTMISGTRAGIAAAVERLQAHKLTARQINVACAFHSPIVAPAQQRLAAALATVDFAPPVIQVFSNTTAQPYPDTAEAIATQLAEHLVEPVRFSDEIEAMYAAGARVFVEVGPRNVLTGLVDQILGQRPHIAIAVDAPGRPGLTQLQHALGKLAAHGVPMQLDRLFKGRLTRPLLNLARLAEETAPKPLPATTWMINGGRSRPIHEPNAPAHQPIKLIKPSVGAATSSNGNGSKPHAPAAAVPVGSHHEHTNGHASAERTNGHTPIAIPTGGQVISASAVQSAAQGGNGPPPAHALAATLSTTPSAAPIMVAATGRPVVMQQFQQLMGRFLETQQHVMLSYLQATSTAAAAPMAPLVPQTVAPTIETTPVELPIADLSVQALMVTPPPTPKEQPAAEPPAAPQPSVKTDSASNQQLQRDDITAQLLGIVAERTGYPTDMLDLDLDLEASLGIDSIKRVEILGQLRQWLTSRGWDEHALPMDQLSGRKSLRGIVDLIVDTQALSASATAEAAPAANGHAASGQQLQRDDITAQLLGIVAERTGYPTDMLDLDLDLEASLGIDSIKRVEILGQLRQWLTSRGWDEHALPMDQLSGRKSLRGIVDLIVDTRAPGNSQAVGQDQGAKAPEPRAATQAIAEPPPSAAATQRAIGTPTASELEIQRFALHTVQCPLGKPAQGLAAHRTVVITDDTAGVAQQLAQRLQQAGHPVALLRTAGGEDTAQPPLYAVDLRSPESVANVLATIRQDMGQIAALVHLTGLQAHQPFEQLDGATWDDYLATEARALFMLAQALQGDLLAAAAAGGGALLAASGFGGMFGINTDAWSAATAFPGTGAVAGLVKTLALEWPTVRARAVDLDLRDDAATLADRLLAELTTNDAHAEAGYHAGQRIIVEPTLSPLAGEQQLTIERDWVLLVTGGARGITADVALELAQRHQPTLLLVGRSAPPPAVETPATAGLTSPQELKAALITQLQATGQKVTPAQVERAYQQVLNEREARANLQALEQAGARVHYFAVDVRDAQAFSALIYTIYRDFGRIDGVIHGAGIIEDKLIQDKSIESFDRVVRTKVDSAFVLSRALRPQSLRFLMFFSSVSGRFGNRGQADYAAANEVLNKLAALLDHNWPGRVVAINWGPWQKRGMVSAELEQEFARRGVRLIPAADGRRFAADELRYGRKGVPEIVVMGTTAHAQPTTGQRSVTNPLLQQFAITASASGIEATGTLDPQQHVYLRDHQLDGKPVFPFAMAMELMAEVVQHAWPDLTVIGLRNMQLFKGIVLDTGAKRISIRAQAQTAPPADRIGIDVSVEIADAERPQLRFYRATLELADHAPQPQDQEPPPIGELQPYPLSVSDAYGRWLFHGPIFAGITAIQGISDQGMSATLAHSSPQRCLAGQANGNWLIDPVVFDSGLQLIILWTRAQLDMTSLPARFERYQHFGAHDNGPIACYLQVRDTQQEQVLSYNLYFYGSDGRLLGLLHNMECPYNQALNRLAGGSAELAAAGPTISAA